MNDLISIEEVVDTLGMNRQYFLRNERYAKHPAFLATVTRYGKKKIKYDRAQFEAWYRKHHAEDTAKGFAKSIEQVRNATNVGVIVG